MRPRKEKGLATACPYRSPCPLPAYAPDKVWRGLTQAEKGQGHKRGARAA